MFTWPKSQGQESGSRLTTFCIPLEPVGARTFICLCCWLASPRVLKCSFLQQPRPLVPSACQAHVRTPSSPHTSPVTWTACLSHLTVNFSSLRPSTASTFLAESSWQSHRKFPEFSSTQIHLLSASPLFHHSCPNEGVLPS